MKFLSILAVATTTMAMDTPAPMAASSVSSSMSSAMSSMASGASSLASAGSSKAASNGEKAHIPVMLLATIAARQLWA